MDDWFGNLATRWKLLLAFAPMVLCQVWIVWATNTSLHGLLDAQNIIFFQDLPSSFDSLVLANNVNRLRLALQIMTLVDDDTVRDKELHEMSVVSKESLATITRLEQSFRERSVDLAQVRNLRGALEKFSQSVDAVQVATTAKLSDEEKRKILSSEHKNFKKMTDLAATLENACLGVTKKNTDASVQTTQSAIFTVQLVGMVTVVVSAMMMIVLYYQIATPLQGVSSAAKHIAEGNLKVVLPDIERSDEVGVLVNSFSTLVQSLRALSRAAILVGEGDMRVKPQPISDEDMLGHAFAAMVGKLSEATLQIAGAARVLHAATDEILLSVTQSSAGASTMASAIDSTTMTVESLRQMALSANEKAQLVAETAQRSREYSVQGSDSVNSMIDVMKKIESQVDLIANHTVKLGEKNQSIHAITTVVSELAVQADILALNAAIEATRAGEHGRGFVAVASSMRGLAVQSKDAANQIRSMLREIETAINSTGTTTTLARAAVDAAVKQSELAGSAIANLTNSVSESANHAKQIANASQLQLIGIGHAVDSMNEIQNETSQNLVACQHVEKATRNLMELGVTLRALVDSHYKV